MRIALTGGRSPLALYFAKKFQKKGHTIYMLEHFNPTFATYSRFIYEIKILPSPAFEWEKFRNELLIYLQEKKIDFLLPINEEMLYYAKMQDEIQELGIFFLVGTMSLLEKLHNKYKFITWCESIGIKVPATKRYQNQNIDFENFLVKPEYSRFGQSVFFTLKEFSQANQRLNYIVQKKISGQQICVMIMKKENQIVLKCVYDTNLGVENYASVTFVPFEHPNLEKIISILGKHLDKSGIYSFDFFFDGTNFFPIECNPRVTFGAVLVGDVFVSKLLNEEEPLLIGQNSYGIKIIWFWRMVTKKSWRRTFSQYRLAKDVLHEAFTGTNWFFLPWVFLNYYSQSKKLKLSITDFVVHDISYPSSKKITHDKSTVKKRVSRISK